MPDYQLELRAAIDAARLAGALIRFHAGRPRNVREKGQNDFVTETDEAAQDLIITRLAADFPDYEVLAEEGAEDGVPPPPTRPRWIIDPLDGTTNFAHGLPPYCVSIGLQDASGGMVAGVIYEVGADELFAAASGGGATLNGRPIRVSETARLADALVTTGFPFRELWYVEQYVATLEAFMRACRGVRRPGSAAADMAYLACGRFDGFFEAGLAPWDVAAGIAIIREAGGTVTGLLPDGDPLFGQQICASNAIIHDEMVATARPLGERHAQGK